LALLVLRHHVFNPYNLILLLGVFVLTQRRIHLCQKLLMVPLSGKTRAPRGVARVFLST
jgi:hypothetical protein